MKRGLVVLLLFFVYSCTDEQGFTPAPSLEEIAERFEKGFFADDSSKASQSVKDMEKIAVIVEPRKHKNLETVVRSVLEKDWVVQIFHGTDNEDFVKGIFSEEIGKGEVILTKMLVKNLTLKDYNNMMLSTFFWNRVKGKNVLMFETDSSFCGSDSTKKIDDFLGYDYVGAPWKNGMKCGVISGTKILLRSLQVMIWRMVVSPDLM